MGRGNSEGRRAAYCKAYRHSAVSCAKTAETIKMPFRIWTKGTLYYMGIQIAHAKQIAPCKGAIFRGNDMPRVCPTTLLT